MRRTADFAILKEVFIIEGNPERIEEILTGPPPPPPCGPGPYPGGGPGGGITPRIGCGGPSSAKLRCTIPKGCCGGGCEGPGPYPSK